MIGSLEARYARLHHMGFGQHQPSESLIDEMRTAMDWRAPVHPSDPAMTNADAELCELRRRELHDRSRLEFIFKLDLKPVMDKIVKAGKWGSDSHVLELEYKRWLYLAFKFPKTKIGVPKPIDEVWHEHILFTKEYAAMCDRAGFFLHHVPRTSKHFTGIDRDAPATTEKLYYQCFGTALPDVWKASAMCRCSGDNCSRCEKPA